MPGEDGKMTFLEHLEELRRRIIYCVIAFIGGVIVCWTFREQICAFLEAPLYEAWASVEGLPPPQPLSFTSLIEPFMLYMRLSAIGGVFLAVPVILYNLWKFVSPGLYKRERRIVLPFIFVSSLLFLGGSTLAYTYVFPIGIRFFLDFAAGGVQEDFSAAAVSVSPKAPVPEEVFADLEDAGAFLAESDAGVEDAGLVEEQKPREAPRVEEIAMAPPKQRSLYDLALEKILSEGCGELAASPGKAGEIALAFNWHEKECGAPPELKALLRDGEAIDVAWAAFENAPEGFAGFSAKDIPPRGGRHEYSLHTLGKGGDGRKLAPVLMLSDYLSFALKMLFAFGVVFELPILIVFLSLAGLVTYKQLLGFSRWFLVIALVIGAVLTPPDVMSQVMLATPLIVLYFVSVVFAYFIERNRNARNS